MDLAFLVPADLTAPSGGNTYNAELGRALAAAGVKVGMVPVPGRWPCLDGRQHQVLERTLRGCGVALVDGIIASGAPGALRAAAAGGTRVAVLVHMPLPAEDGLSAGVRRAYAAAEGGALRAACAAICPSPWAMRDLRQRYALDNIHVALPGANPAPVSAGSTPPRLLTIAALTPGKNHAVLLAALEQLVDLPWTAHWVGPDGPGGPAAVQGASLREAVSASAVSSRVAFTGALAGKALEREWHQADLLVLPSLWETYGLVVSEALAHGVPAVVGAGTAAAETLAGPGTSPSAMLAAEPRAPGALAGAAVDPRDPGALAAALRGWLAGQGIRSAWAAEAARRRSTLRPWADTAAEVMRALTA